MGRQGRFLGLLMVWHRRLRHPGCRQLCHKNHSVRKIVICGILLGHPADVLWPSDLTRILWEAYERVHRPSSMRPDRQSKLHGLPVCTQPLLSRGQPCLAARPARDQTGYLLHHEAEVQVVRLHQTHPKRQLQRLLLRRWGLWAPRQPRPEERGV